MPSAMVGEVLPIAVSGGYSFAHYFVSEKMATELAKEASQAISVLSDVQLASESAYRLLGQAVSRANASPDACIPPKEGARP